MTYNNIQPCITRPLLLLFLMSFWTLSGIAADQNSPAEMAKMIEGPQDSGNGELSSLTFEEVMKHANVPGVSIAVFKDFKIHWAKAYGISDVKTGARVNTETLFQAASISKTLNAMAVLKAVQDGKFSLDDDINSILKSWQLPDSEFNKNTPVTPRMLASHTAGLGDGFGFPGYLPTEPMPTMVQLLDGKKPSSGGPVRITMPPFTKAKYSGGGTTILQLALSDTYGRPYKDLMHDLVLKPVGMTNSVFEHPLSPKHDKNASRAHDKDGKAREAKWHQYKALAAAGLWTTPTDLAKFGIEVQKSLRGEANNVLSQTMIKEMLSPVGVGPFAVGFIIKREGEGWYFNHSGGNWGFNCLLFAHKVKGYGFAIMTNTDNAGDVIQEFKNRVARVYGYDLLDETQF